MALTFDGNTIEGSRHKITALEYYSLPSKKVDLFELANTDRSSISNVNYPNRIIKVEGKINCTPSISLDEAEDIFKGYFVAKNANLDIDHDGGVRRYVATVNMLDIQRTISLSTISFAIEFICTDPFGIDTSSTSIANVSGHTSATYSVSPTIGGTAPYQLPIITITLDTITGTGDYLQISNDNNSQSILLIGLGLVDDDVVVIDCDKRIVTVNDEEVDYTGTFLELPAGTNDLTYTDGFDTRNVDINIDYYKRWL